MMKKSIALLSLFLILILFIGTNSMYLELPNKIKTSIKKNITSNKEDIPTYSFYIEIPKLSLKAWLNEHSNLDNNISINKHSDMPNVIGGNFILQAHSGTGYNAYFRDLYKLKNGDLVYIYYNDIMYYYKIDSYYEVVKTGKIKINRDTSKSSITLITCKGQKEQLVYIGYLEKKESLS